MQAYLVDGGAAGRRVQVRPEGSLPCRCLPQSSTEHIAHYNLFHLFIHFHQKQVSHQKWDLDRSIHPVATSSSTRTRMALHCIALRHNGSMSCRGCHASLSLPAHLFLREVGLLQSPLDSPRSELRGRCPRECPAEGSQRGPGRASDHNTRRHGATHVSPTPAATPRAPRAHETRRKRRSGVAPPLVKMGFRLEWFGAKRDTLMCPCVSLGQC